MQILSFLHVARNTKFAPALPLDTLDASPTRPKLKEFFFDKNIQFYTMFIILQLAMPIYGQLSHVVITDRFS